MATDFTKLATDIFNKKPVSTGSFRSPMPLQPQLKIGLKDVVREIPENTNRVLAGIRDFVAEMAQFTARTGASTFLSLKQIPALLKGEKPKFEQITPEGRPIWEQVLTETVFGKKPVKDWATRIAEGEIATKEFSQKLQKSEVEPIRGLGEKIEKEALGISGLGLALMSGLDFTTGGGSKASVSLALKNANKIDDVMKILQKIGVADDLIRPAAEKFVTMTDEKLIIQGLNKLDDLQRTTKQIIETQAIKRTPDVIEQVAKVATKERGFVTSAKEVIPQATKIAGQYIPRSTDKLSIKAANLIKDNIAEAEKLAKTGTDEKAVATASELLKHYAKQADLATDIATKNAIYDQAAEIANVIARNLTEHGRSVQAASILGRLTPEGQVRWAAKEILEWNRLNPRKTVPELTGAQVKEIANEMKAIQEMAEGEAKAIRFQQLQNKIKSLVPSKWWEKVVAVWKAGLLTGIKTTGLNIFANISHTGTEIAKDLPASWADMLMSLFTGERKVVFSAKKLPEGVVLGTKKGWTYLKTGYDVRDVGAKLDYKKVNFKNKTLQKYVDGVFRLLGAEDQPFYYGALKRSIYNQAKAQSINKGLKGAQADDFIRKLLENPTDEMTMYALADAETAVFQNATALGRLGTTMQKVPGLGFVVPFARTPSAVAMQVINYSPVGPVLEIAKQISRGKFDQKLLSQAIGRGTLGTAVLYIGGLLFNKGLITLDYPKTEKEKELWKIEGRKANSIKIGDKWRTVQILGPAGPVLLMGGHFQNALKDGGSQTEAMIEAVFGTLKSFTEQTFLKGVNDVVGAVTDPQRNAEYVASSFVSSFIPTIINDVARAKDPKERRSENVLQRIQSRVPILRERLEPQITVLGQERQRVGNALEVMIDPTRPSPDVSTSVVQELRRLTDEGYKVSPSLLGDKKGFKTLTQEENTRLWKFAGQITNDKLTSLFNKEKYHKLDDEEKGKIIEKITHQAQINARAGMVLKLTEGLVGEELKKKLSELKAGGLLTKEVFNKYQELR